MILDRLILYFYSLLTLQSAGAKRFDGGIHHCRDTHAGACKQMPNIPSVAKPDANDQMRSDSRLGLAGRSASH
jgi:hypothetical protein